MQRVVESKWQNAAQRQVGEDGVEIFITLRVRPGRQPGRASQSHGMYSPMTREEADQVSSIVGRIGSRPRRTQMSSGSLNIVRCWRGFSARSSQRVAFTVRSCCPLVSRKLLMHPLLPLFCWNCPPSPFATDTPRQEQARWHLSLSTGPLPSGTVDVTLAAFGGEADSCAALPVVSAIPEDGCLPLLNAQQVCGE